MHNFEVLTHFVVPFIIHPWDCFVSFMFTHFLQSLFDHHSKWHFVDSLLGTFVLNCLYARLGLEHEPIVFKRYMVRLYNTFQCIHLLLCAIVLFKMFSRWFFANKKNNYHPQDVEIWRRNVECHDLTFGVQRVRRAFV